MNIANKQSNNLEVLDEIDEGVNCSIPVRHSQNEYYEMQGNLVNVNPIQ